MGMSHIPSLDPRHPRPRPHIELTRLFELILSLGALRFALRFLDLFGDGQSAIDIYQLLPRVLQFIGAPWFAGSAFVVGFAGLIWQAWVQAKFPESVPANVLVDPYTRLPIRSETKIWPTVKRPFCACIAGVCLAGVAWAYYRTPLGTYIRVEPPPRVTVNPPIPPDLHFGRRQPEQSKEHQLKHSIPPVPNPSPYVPPSIQPTTIQRQPTRTDSSAVSPYKELTDVYRQAVELDANWQQAILQVNQDFARPYKVRPSRPMPKELPDSLLQNIVDADSELTYRYQSLLPMIQKASDDAIDYMNLTPNQKADDQRTLKQANIQALGKTPIVELQKNQPNRQQFQVIVEYLGKLKDQLGNYPDLVSRP
jgi:hypothetical protein